MTTSLPCHRWTQALIRTDEVILLIRVFTGKVNWVQIDLGKVLNPDLASL
jgi:hypothetical protein